FAADRPWPRPPVEKPAPGTGAATPCAGLRAMAGGRGHPTASRAGRAAPPPVAATPNTPPASPPTDTGGTLRRSNATAVLAADPPPTDPSPRRTPVPAPPGRTPLRVWPPSDVATYLCQFGKRLENCSFGATDEPASEAAVISPKATMVPGSN